LLPLMAMSATAHAGSTITDQNYWPSEARQSTQTRTGGSQSALKLALAYNRAGSRLQSVTAPNAGESAWRYQGGPKSQVTHTGGR
jgi:hypothetical protein